MVCQKCQAILFIFKDNDGKQLAISNFFQSFSFSICCFGIIIKVGTSVHSTRDFESATLDTNIFYYYCNNSDQNLIRLKKCKIAFCNEQCYFVLISWISALPLDIIEWMNE